MNIEKFAKSVEYLGYATIYQYLIRFSLPCVGVALLSSVVLVSMVSLPMYTLYILWTLALGIIIAYPLVSYESKRVNIQENLHLFITYAGTISTMKISRGLLFKKISESDLFDEISVISKRILYLSKNWNLGFARTFRKVGSMVPSKTLGDFLQRFAIVMDFGEEVDTFLLDEQDAVMTDYETEYLSSLESIRMVQNLFISLTISLAFVMSIALMMPLVIGTPIEIIVLWSVFGTIVLDGTIVLLVRMFIPKDSLADLHDCKDRAVQRLNLLFKIMLVVSVVILFGLFWTDIPFYLTFALAITPLFVVGMYARRIERVISRRDKTFPTLIRTLGSLIEIKSGAVITSLRAMRIHDFGLMNSMVVNLYRRLRLGVDKFRAWYYFAAETGSSLIHRFIKIFTESIYLGGNAEKISEIVSQNFNRLLSLRKRRLQMASGLRSAAYGSIAGLTATTFVTIQIVHSLSTIFSGAPGSSDVGLSTLLPTLAPTFEQIDISKITTFIFAIVIVHALIFAYLIKLVDGGVLYAGLLDFVVMIWIGVAIIHFVPQSVETLIPGFDNILEPVLEE